MLLRGNRVESRTDARRIRAAIVGEIGAVPHALTKAIWRVPVSRMKTLDVSECLLFHKGRRDPYQKRRHHAKLNGWGIVKLKPASDSVAELSLEDVLTHVARAQDLGVTRWLARAHRFCWA